MKGFFSNRPLPFLALLTLTAGCAGPNLSRKPASSDFNDCAQLFDATKTPEARSDRLRLQPQLQHQTPMVSVPEIRMVPFMNGHEFPVWRVSYQPSDGTAQQGGVESLQYESKELAGKDGLRVVAVSNERFRQVPEWAPLHDWLSERGEIADAPEYRDRSKYWITRRDSDPGRPLPDSMKKIETTYGLTWSEYTREDIEGKSAEQIYNDPKIRLPEEKTLQVQVKRYFDSRGRGLAMEFRAVSKDPSSTPNWLRDEGANQMIRGILEKTKEYPELYDKPIVTIYADGIKNPDGTIDPNRGHRVLYFHWMRMTLQSETTPEDHPRYLHDKSGNLIESLPWWVIEVSPKALEEILISRLKGGRTVNGSNLPIPFKLPDGREAIAQAGTQIGFDLDGNVTQATFQNEVELAPGIIAPAGSTAYWVDQNLVYLNELSSPTTFQLGSLTVDAPKESSLEWDSPYLRAELEETETDYYQPNIGNLTRPFVMPFKNFANWMNTMHRAAVQRTLQIMRPRGGWDHEVIAEVNKQARIYRKELGPPQLSRVRSNSSNPISIKNLNVEVTQIEAIGDNYVFRLAKDTQLSDGLIAAEGTDSEFLKTPGGWTWTRVCLGKDASIEGKRYSKGTVLIRVNGKIVELTKASAEEGPHGH